VLQSALPAWILFASIAADRYRTQEKMAWQLADLRHRAQARGVNLDEVLAGTRASELSQRLRRADASSFRDNLQGAHRELFFLQQLDRAGSFLPLVQGCLAQAGLGGAPLGVYIQPTTQGVNCHVEFTLSYDPRKDDEARRSQSAWTQAAQHCAQAGAFFSRPYGAWSDIAFKRDRAILPMLTIAKSVFDPLGVMNPGRLPY